MDFVSPLVYRGTSSISAELRGRQARRAQNIDAHEISARQAWSPTCETSIELGVTGYAFHGPELDG